MVVEGGSSSSRSSRSRSGCRSRSRGRCRSKSKSSRSTTRSRSSSSSCCSNSSSSSRSRGSISSSSTSSMHTYKYTWHWYLYVYKEVYTVSTCARSTNFRENFGASAPVYGRSGLLSGCLTFSENPSGSVLSVSPSFWPSAAAEATACRPSGCQSHARRQLSEPALRSNLPELLCNVPASSFPSLSYVGTTPNQDNHVSLATLRAKLHVRHCTSIVSLVDAGLRDILFTCSSYTTQAMTSAELTGQHSSKKSRSQCYCLEALSTSSPAPADSSHILIAPFSSALSKHLRYQGRSLCHLPIRNLNFQARHIVSAQNCSARIPASCALATLMRQLNLPSSWQRAQQSFRAAERDIYSFHMSLTVRKGFLHCRRRQGPTLGVGKRWKEVELFQAKALDTRTLHQTA